MRLEEAIELLGNKPIPSNNKQVWADLGCGTGLFTEALASLLPDQSLVYAIDTDRLVLDSISDQLGYVSIEKVQGDFIKEAFPFEQLDGILMANSLHYVEDKQAFIEKATTVLKRDASILVVEYEARNANPWVPYPIGFNSLKMLIEGFSSVEKIMTMPSKYGHTIYSARIIR